MAGPKYRSLRTRSIIAPWCTAKFKAYPHDAVKTKFISVGHCLVFTYWFTGTCPRKWIICSSMEKFPWSLGKFKQTQLHLSRHNICWTFYNLLFIPAGLQAVSTRILKFKNIYVTSILHRNHEQHKSINLKLTCLKLIW